MSTVEDAKHLAGYARELAKELKQAVAVIGVTRSEAWRARRHRPREKGAAVKSATARRLGREIRELSGAAQSTGLLPASVRRAARAELDRIGRDLRREGERRTLLRSAGADTLAERRAIVRRAAGQGAVVK